MVPLVNDGDYVTLKGRRVYWPGDVIGTLASPNDLVLHRCIGYYVNGDGLRMLTQADNAKKPDGPIPLRNVIGRLDDHHPNAGDRIAALHKYANAMKAKARRVFSR